MSDIQDDNRIVQARLRRMERVLARAAQTPSIADESPLGEGPKNRHGMPSTPPGQRIVRSWPVLDLGITPKLEADQWRLVVDGAVDRPLDLDFAALLALPQIEDVSDFHCVTSWSKLDMRWTGVRLSEILAACDLHPQASHLMCYGSDGYTTNVSLEEAVKPDVLLVHQWEGQPLPTNHGGPVRMITPQLYAWKGSKWISRIEVMIGDQPGFWEQRGYSMTAYPWRNDRYSR